YYETYGEVFPENDFDIAIIADRDYDRIPAGLQIQQFITHEQSWSISGNPDVFKYAIKRIAFDSGDEMIVAPDINSSELVGIIMIFNEVEAGVVLAKRKQAKI
ncbi:MAG TPA: hypothetical protein VG603_07745, partial [Chitinophagales bacterium]|nr:hypothetical protein [Chitinophagales bacterium]